MTAREHAEATLAAIFTTLATKASAGAILAAVEAAMQDARAEEHTPPSDDLRAAMEALRAEYELRNCRRDLDTASVAVLAAWDAQQDNRH